MDWQTLLNPSRLDAEDSGGEVTRSAFQKDVDRIVFSSAFRRLQDKTQVHPLPTSDYVRTRLTHSIEVASLGRSLATRVGHEVLSQSVIEGVSASDFGDIVAAACLAHDIGNPPFGHAGESAIQRWFKANPQRLDGLSEAEKADFLQFEGNAQGFRNIKPLSLTAATLGAFTKYPRAASVLPQPDDVGGKKFGFFTSEQAMFGQVAQAVGLIPREPQRPYWCRHPLAFLMEAADDICYTIVDVEDGYKLGKLSFDEAETWLLSLSGATNLQRYHTLQAPDLKISTLRGYAIGHLVESAGNVFLDNLPAILSGSFDASLRSYLPECPLLEEIGAQTAQKVFLPYEVIEKNHAHSLVLGDLLGVFLDVMDNKPVLPVLKRRVVQTLGDPDFDSLSPYARCQRATDYVSGMTDSYALHLHQTLSNLI